MHQTSPCGIVKSQGCTSGPSSYARQKVQPCKFRSPTIEFSAARPDSPPSHGAPHPKRLATRDRDNVPNFLAINTESRTAIVVCGNRDRLLCHPPQDSCLASPLSGRMTFSHRRFQRGTSHRQGYPRATETASCCTPKAAC